MMPDSRFTPDRSTDTARGDLSLLGLLGYLAVAIGALALLSAPVLTVTALATVVAARLLIGSRLAVQDGADTTRVATDDSTSVTADPVSE